MQYILTSMCARNLLRENNIFNGMCGKDKIPQEMPYFSSEFCLFYKTIFCKLSLCASKLWKCTRSNLFSSF
jgi:hypothetical protein